MTSTARHPTIPCSLYHRLMKSQPIKLSRVDSQASGFETPNASNYPTSSPHLVVLRDIFFSLLSSSTSVHFRTGIYYYSTALFFKLFFIKRVQSASLLIPTYPKSE
ncbi:Uncharacterized protein Fot_18576 [Forsythia ovata]|uniref:Uncharacterized protein n=1 Tax=Forsythia ovata TaxID=205694 RepID=A0ABD1VLC7_9LAMI